MQIINDYYMVTVTSRYESTKSPSGIIMLNAAVMHDENIDRFQYKRIYGRVEMVPLRYTQTPVEIKDPGFPAPKKHISGEQLEAQYRSGLKKLNKNYYSAAGFDEYELLTKADIARDTDIRRLDKVYFDPRATEPENLIGTHQHREMYMISVEEIICVVREGEILVQGQWCLVEPDMESWEDITTPSGIIKKPRPEAKYLRGIMRHFQHRDDLKEGDHVIYHVGADWLVTIEGKKYYSIERNDIVCKIEP